MPLPTIRLLDEILVLGEGLSIILSLFRAFLASHKGAADELITLGEGLYITILMSRIFLSQHHTICLICNFNPVLSLCPLNLLEWVVIN